VIVVKQENITKITADQAGKLLGGSKRLTFYVWQRHRQDADSDLSYYL
jgi:hypothetical protein